MMMAGIATSLRLPWIEVFGGLALLLQAVMTGACVLALKTDILPDFDPLTLACLLVAYYNPLFFLVWLIVELTPGKIRLLTLAAFLTASVLMGGVSWLSMLSAAS